MTMYQDPALADDQIVVTRAWLQIVTEDITFIACELGVIPAGSVARGAGIPGLEFVVMPAGSVLVAAVDGLRAIAPPATGTYLWEPDSTFGGKWANEADSLNSAKFDAIVRQ